MKPNAFYWKSIPCQIDWQTFNKSAAFSQQVSESLKNKEMLVSAEAQQTRWSGAHSKAVAKEVA